MGARSAHNLDLLSLKLLSQDAHDQTIVIAAVSEQGLPLAPFELEASLLVAADSAGVKIVDLQLDTVQVHLSEGKA